MKKMFCLMFTGLMVVCFAMAVSAQDKVAKPAEAKELVKKMIDYAKAHGCEQTIKEINSGSAFKIYKNVFASASTLDGISLAHAKVPALVGKNIMDIKDADGKPFVRLSLERRKKNLTEMLTHEYKWMDTKTNKVETRTMIGIGHACGGSLGDVSFTVTYEGKI
jgi:signal transduction histidine kinase